MHLLDKAKALPSGGMSLMTSEHKLFQSYKILAKHNLDTRQAYFSWLHTEWR